MKTLHALSLVSVLASACFVGSAFTGCSSSTTDPPATVDNDSGAGDTGVAVDTGTPVDSGVKDTGTPPKDTGSPGDAPSTLCDQPLASDFACKAAVKPPGGTTCDEKAIQDFMTACLVGTPGGTADLAKAGSGCAAWKSAHADCLKCMNGFALSGGKYPLPDRDKCWWDAFDKTCADEINCDFDCQSAVCGGCSQTPGSGADGSASGSEFLDCFKRATKKKTGVCAPYSDPASPCFATASSDPAIGVCTVGELFSPSGTGGKPDYDQLKDQMIQYWRGACRDNAKWDNAGEVCGTPPCTTPDAGSDTSPVPDVAVDVLPG